MPTKLEIAEAKYQESKARGKLFSGIGVMLSTDKERPSSGRRTIRKSGGVYQRNGKTFRMARFADFSKSNQEKIISKLEGDAESGGVKGALAANLLDDIEFGSGEGNGHNAYIRVELIANGEISLDNTDLDFSIGEIKHTANSRIETSKKVRDEKSLSPTLSPNWTVPVGS